MAQQNIQPPDIMETLIDTTPSTVKMTIVKTQAKPYKSNYDQLDTIRFITICIIVWSHALFPEWRLRTPESLAGQILKTIVIQAGATSTIIFFIVSGILMHSKLQAYNLKTYFRERIPRIYAPWLFFVCLNALLLIIHQLPVNELVASPANILKHITSIYNILNGLLIYGPYWFVITYLVGMVILIIFKKHEASPFFGAFLLFMTLFYCVNFHTGWIDTFHTKAVVAYTFFIWLGFKVHLYWKLIVKKVQEARWIYFIIASGILFSLACLEGFLLSQKGVNDSFASNRFSNIIFSLIFFLVLLKIGAIRMINELHPRKIVYGIYLVNSIVILGVSVILNNFLEDLSHINLLTLLGIQFIYFSIVLFLTFMVVHLLATSRVQWLIGSR